MPESKVGYYILEMTIEKMSALKVRMAIIFGMKILDQATINTASTAINSGTILNTTKQQYKPERGNA